MKTLALFLGILLPFSMFTQNLDEGLQGWYNLNNNFIDSSPNEINGIGYNLENAIGLEGFEQTSYLFNGDDGYIDLTEENRNISNEVSLSAWIKTFDDKRQFIVSKYNWQEDKGYFIGTDEGGHALIGGRVGCGEFYQCVSNNRIDDGEWHHVVGIIKNDIFEIWIDCELDNTLDYSCNNVNLSCSHPMTIGNWWQGSTTGDYRHFNGIIDEVRIYNRPLTEDEIKLLCDINLSTNVDYNINTFNTKISPNPSSGHFTLTTNIENYEKYNYNIYNWQGSLIQTGSLTNSINLTEVSGGTYTLQIITQDQIVYINKLIVQR